MSIYVYLKNSFFSFISFLTELKVLIMIIIILLLYVFDYTYHSLIHSRLPLYLFSILCLSLWFSFRQFIEVRVFCALAVGSQNVNFLIHLSNKSPKPTLINYRVNSFSLFWMVSLKHSLLHFYSQFGFNLLNSHHFLIMILDIFLFIRG